MIRRTKVLRVASILLAALPLASQIAAEARQAAAPRHSTGAALLRVLRVVRASCARGQLLRLSCRRKNGRPAPRLARRDAERRPIRPGPRTGRSREKPDHRGGAPDASD